MSARPSSSTSKDMPSASVHGLRRSFTLPSRLANPTKPQQDADIGAADGIETLFVHPSARIVSFSSASSLRSRPSSRSSVISYDGEGDGPTSLPWTSATERTMAAGPLEIYRVPGSVAFLHSGSLLHAILPRSQCWCVDGVSKFAMRVLPNTYYRIELPGDSQEDLEHVEQLKKTLAKVLYYEKTACPFQRGFGEDLPEMPSRNSRRLSREFIEPAKRWRLDKVWRPEGVEVEEPHLLYPDRSQHSSDTERSEVDDTARSDGDESGKDRDTRPASRDKAARLSGPFPSKKLAAMRSVTAPPQLSLESSPPSKVNKVREMAGLFNQTARDSAKPLSRPVSSTLVPKLPPTPESADDEAFPSEESSSADVHENSVINEPLESIPDEPIAVVLTEHAVSLPTDPLIIVEKADAEPIHPKLEYPNAPSLENQDSSSISNDNGGSSPEATQEQATTGAPEEEHETISNIHKPSITEHTPQPSTDDQTPPPSTSTSTTSTSAPFTASSPTLSTASLSTATSWSTLPVLTPSEASDLLRQRRPSPSASSRSVSPSPPTPSSSSSTTLTPTSPALLVRKTCALFLGPPATLVATMLRIAARLVASGALNLAEPAFHDLFAGASSSSSSGAAAATSATLATQQGRLRGHRRVPGSWDLSDDDEDWGF